MIAFLRRLFGGSSKGDGSLVHYTGHRILADAKRSRFPAGRERSVARAVRKVLDKEGVVAGVGGLASGSDILIAEALLARGADLHIVLPCEDDRYVDASVAEAGKDWVRRFHAMTSEATTLTYLEDDGAGSDIDFSGASDLALEMAREMAEEEGRSRFQLALFDGVASEGAAGTGADIATGRDLGWRQLVLLIRPRGKIKLL
jgi:adenylate cyclase